MNKYKIFAIICYIVSAALIILAFIAAVSLCSCSLTESNSEPEKPLVIQPGLYTANLYNFYEYTDDSGDMHNINMSGYMRLNLAVNLTYVQTVKLDITVDGYPVLDSAKMSGIWSQAPGLLCFDDGTGKDCENVKNITDDSFIIAVSDLELVQILGTNWVVFIK